jgi:hypothetical protein
MMVSRKFEITQTRLILQSNACILLSHEKIKTSYLSTHDNFCSVTIPFRANKFSNGGMIDIGDREILISDNQVISAEVTDPQDWTHEQVKSLILVMLGLVFTTVFGATLFFTLKGRG